MEYKLPSPESIMLNWFQSGNPAIEPPVRNLLHPELTYRLNGTWQGWFDYLGPDSFEAELLLNGELDELEDIAFSKFCKICNIDPENYQFPSLTFSELKERLGYLCQADIVEDIVQEWMIFLPGSRTQGLKDYSPFYAWEGQDPFKDRYGEHADSVVPEFLLREAGTWRGWADYLGIEPTAELAARDRLEDEAYAMVKGEYQDSVFYLEKLNEILFRWRFDGAQESDTPLKYLHPEYVGRLMGTWRGWAVLGQSMANIETQRKDLLEEYAFRILETQLLNGEISAEELFAPFLEGHFIHHLMEQWDTEYTESRQNDHPLSLSLFLRLFGSSLTEHMVGSHDIKDIYHDTLADKLWPFFNKHRVSKPRKAFERITLISDPAELLNEWELRGNDKDKDGQPLYPSFVRRLECQWDGWGKYYGYHTKQHTLVDDQNELEDAVFDTYCRLHAIENPMFHYQAQSLARLWEFEGYDSHPNLGDSMPSHPEFIFRLSGEWHGWCSFLAEDRDPTTGEEYQDRLEDAAFAIYCETNNVENPYH